VQIKAVLLCNRYLENLRSVERAGPHLMPRRDVTDEDRAVRPAGRSLLEPYPRVSAQAHWPNWGLQMLLMSTPTPPTLRLSISTWCRFAAGWVRPPGEPQLCCQK
jgi:hypothetical protein